MAGQTGARTRSSVAATPPPPRPLDPGAPTRDYGALLLENLPRIERIIASLVRRHAVPPADADDFEGQVKLRLVEDDYAVLRKFRGRSRLGTFLTAVIQNQFRDFRIRQWGKWRPSAAARRMGELGVQLEALLYRDGFGSSEAVAIVRNRHRTAVSREELERIVASLRPRTGRRYQSHALLARLEAPEGAERTVRDTERAEAKARAERALRRALAALDPEDRLLLKMRYAEGLTIRAIASALGLRDRRMYSRLRRLLLEIRRRVEADGVERGEVLDLLDWPDGELEPLLDPAGR